MPEPSAKQEWIVVMGDPELQSMVDSAAAKSDANLKVDSTADPDALSTLFKNRLVSLIICDSDLIPDPGHFLEVFNSDYPEIPLLLISQNQEMIETVEVMRKGAFNVLAAHVSPIELQRVLMLGLVVARNRRELQDRKRIMLRDLEMAQYIQLSLLPPREMAIPGGAAVSTRHIPAEILGGDFFDIAEIEREHIGMIIADVCGHGVAASLVVVVLKTLLLNAAPFVKTPAMFLEHLNIQLLKIVPESNYLSCFYGILNTTTGLLRYASCGHPSPFLLRKDGTLERLQSRGFYLGLDPKLDLEEQSTILDAGDQIISFTDGLTDIRIDEKESYGDERLERCITAYRGLPASKLLDRIIEDVRELTQGRIPDDDIALMCLEYRPQSKKTASAQAEDSELQVVRELTG
jgi:serine phosphatase RsbU (regulator of sigma subunit)/CheY-like chemotaxis protein